MRRWPTCCHTVTHSTESLTGITMCTLGLGCEASLGHLTGAEPCCGEEVASPDGPDGADGPDGPDGPDATVTGGGVQRSGVSVWGGAGGAGCSHWPVGGSEDGTLCAVPGEPGGLHLGGNSGSDGRTPSTPDPDAAPALGGSTNMTGRQSGCGTGGGSMSSGTSAAGGGAVVGVPGLVVGDVKGCAAGEGVSRTRTCEAVAGCSARTSGRSAGGRGAVIRGWRRACRHRQGAASERPLYLGLAG